MKTTIKRAIQDCPSDGLIYLAYKLSDHAGFFVSNKHILYIVANSHHEPSQCISTEYLNLNTNIEIISFADHQQFNSGKYNIVDFIPTDDSYNESDLESFINLCSAHNLYLRDGSFTQFFYSLINLFQYPAEQAYKNLVGLFGELAVIRYIYQKAKKDISPFWHKASNYGKYDFVFRNFNLEVKTSSLDDCEIAIKHSQVFNSDSNVIAAIFIERNNSGISVQQLIDELLSSPDYCNSYEFTLNIEKEKKRISPTAAENTFFSINGIRFYDAKVINPFSTMPQNVSSLAYKLDLSNLPQLGDQHFLDRIED